MVDPRTTAMKLTAQLRATFGEQLRTVVVFGSVPRGEAIPGVSDLNTLVLLDTVGTSSLARAAPVLQDWIRQGNTPPHIYSTEEWSGMRDTFAIEISDMQDARDVLWGTDPVTADPVAPGDLRHQTESEARETLLQLRVRLMLGYKSPEEIGALLLSGFPSFSAYLRATLRLNGENPGRETRPMLERAAAIIGTDPKPMLTCWTARQTFRNIVIPLKDPLVEQYLSFVRDLITHLDQLPEAAPPSPSGGPLSRHSNSTTR
ncbi:MAG: hypothetical protein ACHQSE_02940 [Gemmatimonadales bacterium]